MLISLSENEVRSVISALARSYDNAVARETYVDARNKELLEERDALRVEVTQLKKENEALKFALNEANKDLATANNKLEKCRAELELDNDAGRT